MSVRGSRSVYRERDEEPRRSYTTVKRYQVPDNNKSIFQADEEVKEDKIVIRRERREPSPPPQEDTQWKVTERYRERDPPPRTEVDYRVTERFRERDPPCEASEYHITERIRELERERQAPRRDIPYRVIERDNNDWDRRSHYSHSHHSQSAARSEIVRAPSPPDVVFKFERERDFSPQRRRVQTQERPYELERYSKSTEYFAQPQPQPQPIIIREAAPQPIIIREERSQPIIIREERREPQYDFIEREEVKEQSLVRREDPPPPASVGPSVVPVPVPVPLPPQSQPEPEPEENYFYERRVREVDRDRRTEIRPRDSASQYGSDDSYEYVRRERTYDESRSRSGSPHHKRHLVEGAVAGLGAAEILRHHRKNEGKEVGGRFTQGAAGAAVGALGAEAISRVKSHRSKSRARERRSRSRSSSWEDRRRRRRRRSRSRSSSRGHSLSRAQKLGGLAAVAAVGALAGYAINRNKGKQETVVVNEPPRRSRSRRRRASVDSSYYDDRGSVSDRDGATNPEHRNRRIAQAGLASAAAAGIWERVRSRSRGGRSKGRSKSRVRQGVPIAAAGLGGAALAGLYENKKANKEREEGPREEGRDRGRRRRSRSRSRSVPAPYPEDDRHVDDRGLIAYGHEPIYPDQGRGYYSDEEPGMYRRRHRGGSDSGSSPDTRRRSRSRGHAGRNLAAGGAAAGVAAVAAHEVGKRRERSRQREQEREYERDRRRRDEEAPYHDEYRYEEPVYSPVPVGNIGYLPPEQHAEYAQEPHPYPSSTYFPPPPTGENAREQPYPEQSPYPAYNPADYASGAHQQPAYPQAYGGYAEEDPNIGPRNEDYAGEARYGGHGHHEEERGRDPENVSAPNTAPPPVRDGYESQDADGMSTPRAGRSRSHSRVRFDLDQNTEHQIEARRSKGEEAAREDDERHSDNETSGDGKHRRRRRRHEDGRRERGRRSEASESDSDGTVELPPRFDEQGNRMPEGQGDQLTQAITGILGSAGLTDFLAGLGSSSGRNDDEGRRGGRRRQRH